MTGAVERDREIPESLGSLATLLDPSPAELHRLQVAGKRRVQVALSTLHIAQPAEGNGEIAEHLERAPDLLELVADRDQRLGLAGGSVEMPVRQHHVQGDAEEGEEDIELTLHKGRGQVPVPARAPEGERCVEQSACSVQVGAIQELDGPVPEVMEGGDAVPGSFRGRRRSRGTGALRCQGDLLLGLGFRNSPFRQTGAFIPRTQVTREP